MGRWMKKIKNKQYGQAMVEFALTLPIFLIAVLGVIEMSRFFLVYSSVYTASREAARYASSTDVSGSLKHYEDCDGIRQVAIDSGFFSGVNFNQIEISIEDVPGNVVASCRTGDSVPHTSSGDVYNFEFANRVLVEIATSYQPITPIIPSIPVVASNGRTILSDIRVRDVPEPFPSPTPVGWLGCNSFVFLESSGVVNNNYLISLRNISPDIDFEILRLTNFDWNMNNVTLNSISMVLKDNNDNIVTPSNTIWSGSYSLGDPDIEFSSPYPDLPSNHYTEFTFTFSKNLNSNHWIDVNYVLTDNVSGIVCDTSWIHP